MTITTDLRYEAQIDTKIAAAYDAYQTAVENANRRADYALDAMRCEEHNRRIAARHAEMDTEARRLVLEGNYTRRSLVIPASAVKHLTAIIESDAVLDSDKDQASQQLAKVEAAIEVRSAAADAYAQAEEKYEGWTRFFLVRNNGGHIHKDMNCQTCNKRGKATKFGWLPELSGQSEAEAVAAHGAILCTVCYPTAPVEWTDGRKADDDAYCPADQGLDETKTIRRGYYTGNGGTCKSCGQRVTVTREGYGKIRKHKREAAA